MLLVHESEQACGASVEGLDLARPLTREQIHELRELWLRFHVLAFPQQQLSDADLERITRYFGTIGDDPYFVPMTGQRHVVALTRRADETAPIFAESWHSDWSFKAHPPIGTCLYGITIPPVGGHTSFINQHLALAQMPSDLRSRLQGKRALHSAAAGYAPDGLYGEQDAASDRSMQIVFSEDARAVQAHPIIQPHAETGEDTILGCLGYMVGIEGMASEPAMGLLKELYDWQTREEFQYVHRWQPDMLVIWDNRSVLHKANGGYDGYDRELHRTTIA